MLRLVAYDIRDSKRLHRVAKVCSEYGFRVEYSLFECDLNDQHFETFWSRLTSQIDVSEDRLICYELCRHCAKKIITYGVAERPQKPLLYIM